jgi:hypothetical protein
VDVDFLSRYTLWTYMYISMIRRNIFAFIFNPGYWVSMFLRKVSIYPQVHAAFVSRKPTPTGQLNSHATFRTMYEGACEYLQQQLM